MAHMQRIGCITVAMVGLGIVGCASVTPKAVDRWSEELRNEKFTAMYPPRAGDGLAAVITFDNSGRETVVLAAKDCFPSLRSAQYPVAILTRATQYESSASLGFDVAQVLKGKVDAEGLAAASVGSNLSLALDKPFVERYETALLKSEIAKLAPESQCFRSITNPKNIIIYSTFGAAGVKYKLEDKSGASMKLTAEILKLGKVTPEMATKYNGAAELVVDQQMLVGYKAARADKLPGALATSVELVPLSLEDIAVLRKPN